MRIELLSLLAAATIAFGVIAACGDGDEPFGFAATNSVVSDAGATGDARRDALAVLPPLGPLAIEGSSPLAVFAGRGVALQASVSGGAGPYRLTWTQKSGPSVTLVGVATLNPTFKAPATTTPEVLVFDVTVFDDASASARATVTVTVAPSELAITTSGDQLVGGGQELTLHALPSGELDALAYQWAQTAGTPLLTIVDPTLANARVAIPTVLASAAFTFELTATNGAGLTVRKSVNVTAEPDVSGAGVFAVNAGNDIAVAGGETVRLHGITQHATGARTFAWSQTAGTPSVTLADGSTANPSFVAPAVASDSVLTFQFSVTDGAPSTATDTVSVTLRAAPPLTVSAGADCSVNAGADVLLGGAGRGGAGAYSYLWTQKSGTQFAIEAADGSNPRLTAGAIAVDEQALFEVTISDGKGASATDTVTIALKAQKAPPDSAGPEGLGSAFRQLTEAERTVVTCQGEPCLTAGNQVVCDERAPFALTTLIFNGSGGVGIEKRCVDNATCLDQWWRATSELDQCVSLLPPTRAPFDAIQFGGVASSCKFCCVGKNCNLGLVPAIGTTTTCERTVCYPLGK